MADVGTAEVPRWARHQEWPPADRFERHPPTTLGLYVFYASNLYLALAAKTRMLVDFLVKRFGDFPEWDRFAA